MISAKIIADSAIQGSDPLCRITTFELTMPKWMLAQFNTHGMVRRNAESSRARPTLSVIEQVESYPYLPEDWNYRARGMMPAGPMTPQDAARMDDLEQELRRHTTRIVREMEKLKPAKEDVNRYLEPWMWAKVVATSTTWENYFKLRADCHAQGPHQRLATMMRDAYNQSEPVLRPAFGWDLTSWHLPYITHEDRKSGMDIFLPQISAALCGRVSYGRQGARQGFVQDVGRAQSFVRDGHWSALEPPALASDPEVWYGPFRGWRSLRKMYAGESGSVVHGTQEDHRVWAFRSTSDRELEELWQRLKSHTTLYLTAEPTIPTQP